MKVPSKGCFRANRILSGVVACLIASWVPATVNAATVGYWRFESGSATADSSGNGLTLSATGSGPLNSALGTTSQGTYFSSTIPQTGASNGSMAQGAGTSQSWVNNNYYVADSPALSITSAMTIEAYVNQATSINGLSRVIAGQGANAGGGPGQGSWSLTVTAEDSSRGARNLLFQYQSVAGTWAGTGGLQTIDSNIQLVLGHDYYLACAVNFLDTTSTGLVFYYQDLTLGTALQTVSMTHTVTTIADTTSPLTIGSADASALYWGGSIDEVRLSNSQLGVNDLLITVPEPGSLALVAAGVMGLFVLGRKSKVRRS